MVIEQAPATRHWERLRLLARKKGVKYADLITAWVKEHLRES
ncbi:hypothetical protein [Moorella stamsii]|nr:MULTISPECIES: hypothetical protein [Moorella]